jgi:hypothetical protein
VDVMLKPFFMLTGQIDLIRAVSCGDMVEKTYEDETGARAVVVTIDLGRGVDWTGHCFLCGGRVGLSRENDNSCTCVLAA